MKYPFFSLRNILFKEQSEDKYEWCCYRICSSFEVTTRFAITYGANILQVFYLSSELTIFNYNFLRFSIKLRLRRYFCIR